MIKDILAVTLILFSVIDILGNIPVVLSLKDQGKHIEPGKATLASAVIMIAFLFGGEGILSLFGVDISSFAIAGAIVLFLIGLEMILGVRLFRDDSVSAKATIVPIAFPLIAGAGTLTTILSLRSEYAVSHILIAICINLVLIFLVLRSSDLIQRKLGKTGADVLRKVFGIILLAIAIKLFKSNVVL